MLQTTVKIILLFVTVNLLLSCLQIKLQKKKSLKSQYHDPEYVCGALAETLALMLLGTSMFSVLSQFCLLY